MTSFNQTAISLLIIDSLFLPGKKNGPGGLWDIVGILGTIPATVSCMLGVFAAQVLQSKKMDDKKIVVSLGLSLLLLKFMYDRKIFLKA